MLNSNTLLERLSPTVFCGQNIRNVILDNLFFAALPISLNMSENVIITKTVGM